VILKTVQKKFPIPLPLQLHLSLFPGLQELVPGQIWLTNTTPNPAAAEESDDDDDVGDAIEFLLRHGHEILAPLPPGLDLPAGKADRNVATLYQFQRRLEFAEQERD
jgi:hypothetical protein